MTSTSLRKPQCSNCNGDLERQVVHRGGASAQRLVCPRCSADFAVSEVCAVCGKAQPDKALAVTVHKSGILGTHTTRHCPTCAPLGKIALEFQTSFAAALAKYGCAVGCLGIVLLAILSGLLSGIHH